MLAGGAGYFFGSQCGKRDGKIIPEKDLDHFMDHIRIESSNGKHLRIKLLPLNVYHNTGEEKTMDDIASARGFLCCWESV